MNSESLELPDRSSASSDGELLPEMESLWEEAESIWERFQDDHEFRAFVATDYRAIYDALVRLQGRVLTVLEWGSGLGVVAMMASNLGFEAYGIEIEPRLVDLSCDLAEKYGPDAQFVQGNFIPEQYEWNPEYGDEAFRTTFEGEPGYDELDMELLDFDLVYAYPWPDEQHLFHDIMRQCGGEHSLFLSWDHREGVRLQRFGCRR